jgi:nucleoside-diphosphate-sugar epimerase
MKRLLIAGCGDLGSRLAARLDHHQWQVAGLRRNTESLPESIVPVRADLTQPGSMDSIEPEWDAIIYQPTPGSRDEAAYQRTYVDGLRNLLTRVRARRLIYVSSTAVYGQDDGSWVDEESPTEPAAFNGRLVLEGEKLALESVGNTVVVRFSGIYGPGREYLIKSLKAGRASCRPDPPQWTNRIHVDDCAAVLEHLLNLPAPDSLYCASDCQPAPRCDVLDWIADQLDVDRPERLPPQEGAGQGKRVSSRRLLASGFSFKFPDFRSGYGAILS